MRKWISPLLVSGLLMLSACVTINVYFPAAEAKEAAEEFVDKVIGADKPADAGGQPPQASRQPRFELMSLFINSAQAADGVDITIRTPAIQAIQNRMAERFQTQLEPHFSSGALGFGKDGLVVVREAAKLALKDRVSVTQLVADDNRDRKAVYREIAVANGHPEWEDDIRDIFARQWIESARKGWWYQAGDASWKQK